MCSSAHREDIDRQLLAGVSGTIIIEEAAKRGEHFNHQNLSTHRGRHLQTEVDALLERTRQKLRERAEVEPPTRAALLLIMDKALKDLPHTPARVENILKAIDLLEKLESEDTERSFLAAYMERAFAPRQDPRPIAAPSATVVRQLEAS